MPESIIERFSTQNQKKNAKPSKKIDKLKTSPSKVKKPIFTNNELNLSKGAKENGKHYIFYSLRHFGVSGLAFLEWQLCRSSAEGFFLKLYHPIDRPMGRSLNLTQ